MKIPCSNCGNLLQIVPNINFLLCNKCQTPLQVQQNESTTFLQPYHSDTNFEANAANYGSSQKLDLFREIEMLDKAWEVSKKPAGKMSLEVLNEKIGQYPELKVFFPFFIAFIAAIAAIILKLNVSDAVWIMPTVISVFNFIMGVSFAILYSDQKKQLAVFKKQEKEYEKKRTALKKSYDAL